MEQGVYTFAIGLMIYIESVGATHLETVWLKDVTKKHYLSNNDLPDELAFDLTRRSETLNLNLRRNHHINPNADVYFAQKMENGKFGLVQSDDVETENLAYYQDIHNGAFVTVRCVKNANELCDRIINGNVRIGDTYYTLQPAETEFSSRHILEEDPIVLGRQYILQVESHPPGYDAYGYKDAAYEMDKNIGEKRMTLTQRLKEQLKRKQSSLAVASLSGTNESTLQRDISRQLPQIYYVKMAVLIDKGLWDFYYTTVHSLTALTRKRNAIKLIHQFYSHIMNGVHMIYQSITDTSIRINVVLNTFIIFKSEQEFQHIQSRVHLHRGKMHVDIIPYLTDVLNWDNKTAQRDQPSFSHGMLFSSYKFYRDDVTINTAAGLTVTGGVCDIGSRMSIVERRAYVLTVRAAAHELAHSLGARHDGAEGHEECKPEDAFIMSPDMPTNYPGEPYNKNTWLFSKCSIKSFKKVLPTKTCLRNVGLYYDYQEYHKFLTNEPGEVFSINRQCELTFGSNSVLCETVAGDVCLLMRCTNPKTGICIPRYNGAARGTECGKNRWCINGLCVAKS